MDALLASLLALVLAAVRDPFVVIPVGLTALVYLVTRHNERV